MVQFGSSLRSLVDIATTISFLVAPAIAIMNYRLVSSKDFPVEGRPGKAMRWLSVVGIVFLSGFSLVYLLSLMR